MDNYRSINILYRFSFKLRFTFHLRIVNNNPKKRKLCESPPSTNMNCGYIANYGNSNGYQQQLHQQAQQQTNSGNSPNTQQPSMTPINSCLNMPINTIKQEPGMSL